MERSCDMCGKAYTPKRVTSQYCSSACRTRATRLRAAGVRPALAAVAPAPQGIPVAAAAPAAGSPAGGGLVASTRQQLEVAGRLDSILGQQALVLAARLEVTSGVDTGSSLAAVSKELRAVMAEALAGVAVADDPIDELRRRRELKRSG